MQQEADEKAKARRLEQENARVVQQQIERGVYCNTTATSRHHTFTPEQAAEQRRVRDAHVLAARQMQNALRGREPHYILAFVCMHIPMQFAVFE